MKKYALLAALTFSVATTAHAVEGNATAGETKSAMCTACHSSDGNSVVPSYPKLAGQHENYLAKQLTDFKAGFTSGGKKGRVDPVMGGMTISLTEQDIADLSAFYAKQTISAGDEKGSEIGEKLYLGGDTERGITACIACHGAKGEGMEMAGFPSVANQNVDYLKAQLMNFRDIKRKNDSNAMMRNITAEMEDSDIKALALYMSSMK